jgi:hypothetical protein
MNVVSGRIVLRETGVGVPDVLVVARDIGVSPPSDGSAGVGTSPVLVGAAVHAADAGAQEATTGDGSATAAPAAVMPARGPASLGSKLTDTDGAFEIDYDDALIQGSTDGRRPTLAISVLAPDGPGATVASRTLFDSPDTRANASPNEQYLITIPSDTLTQAGVPIPVDPGAVPQRSQAAIDDMQQALAFHQAVSGAQLTMASQQVSAVRTAAQQLDSVVESSLVSALGIVSPADAPKFNIVAPGVAPHAMVWSTVNQTIDDTINTSNRAGYVVFTAEEAAHFQNPDGTYQQNIPAANIEPYIFQADDAQRTMTILRSDAATAMCRAQVAANPFDPSATDPTITTTATPADAPPTDDPLTTGDLPKFIGRLVDPMEAPEEAGAAIAARPTAADVQASVGGLALGGGPADVTAFYDYCRYQIAFDYVWQQAIDSGLIETGKQLARQLANAGGDPAGALQGGGDPIAALRAEVSHVTTAQQSVQKAGVAYAYVQNGSGSNGAGSQPAPQTTVMLRPMPPMVRPPFVGATVGPSTDTSAEPGDLLTELETLLSERYSFEVFAPGSTNFGLLVTYRQRWEPITYQVGKLVKTLTLAPKETRKVTSKRTIKRERSVKQMEDNQSDRKDESNETMRDEAEIVQKAQQKTNFSQSGNGSYNVGVWSAGGSTNLGREAEGASQETKKQFHEAVLKAAQEYKDERKLEVETKVSYEDEETDSVELTNPNDELTVTYLFYELQRRFRVSEHIHELTPIVFVALDVPNPNRDEIDMVLLSQSWVINRVLLDDRYRAPLEYLCTRIVGDEIALADLEANVQQVNAAVEQLKAMERDMESELSARESALEAATQVYAGAVGGKDNEGFLSEVADDVFGSSAQDPQQAQILEDAAKDSYDRAVQAEKDLRMRLDAETAALSAATEAYAKARAEHGNHLLQIAALRTHFKENVLYYMQAIWSYTFADEMFFSLCNIKVPKLTATSKTYSLKVPDTIPLSIAPKPGQVVLEVDANLQLQSGLDPDNDFVTLAEVADLDSPLGYKGNYMIFPLSQSNPLTDFMMVPYLDSELGIHDPDELGSWTPEDFSQYARCLLQQEQGQLSESDYAALQSQLLAQYKAIVSNPGATTDTVIVPTASLYIEALPGAHPLLENFKLEHRAVDVQRAKAETRKIELENLRYAARILDTQLGDPDFDKQVLIAGATTGVDVTTGDT